MKVFDNNWHALLAQTLVFGVVVLPACASSTSASQVSNDGTTSERPPDAVVDAYIPPPPPPPPPADSGRLPDAAAMDAGHRDALVEASCAFPDMPVQDQSPPTDVIYSETGGLVDEDHDGYLRGVDCNDNDPDTRPLENNSVNRITRSTTICFRTYTGAVVEVAGDCVVVNMAGVTLLGGRILIQGRRSVRVIGALNINNDVAHPVVSIGDSGDIYFERVNLYDFFGGVEVSSSRDVTFNYLAAASQFAASAFTVSNSSEVQINEGALGGQLTARPYGRLVVQNGSNHCSFRNIAFGFQSGVHFNDAHQNSLLDCHFYDSVTVPTNGHRIVLSAGSMGNTIQNNVLDTAMRGTSASGGEDIFVDGSNNIFDSNHLRGRAGSGIRVFGGRANTFSGNVISSYGETGLILDVTPSVEFPTASAPVEETVVRMNSVTDNGRYGVHVTVPTHQQIVSNDLRRNGVGNMLNCGTNTCMGNLL